MTQQTLSPFSTLLHGAVADFRALGREYKELTNIKLREGAKCAKQGFTALAIAAVLGVVGLGQLTYAIVGAFFAKDSAVREQVQITGVTAVVDLLVAGILSYFAARLLNKAMEAPKSLARTIKEDSP